MKSNNIIDLKVAISNNKLDLIKTFSENDIRGLGNDYCFHNLVSGRNSYETIKYLDKMTDLSMGSGILLFKACLKKNPNFKIVELLADRSKNHEKTFYITVGSLFNSKLHSNGLLFNANISENDRLNDNDLKKITKILCEKFNLNELNREYFEKNMKWTKNEFDLLNNIYLESKLKLKEYKVKKIKI